ncbi:MAG: zinc-binding dehydrogenase [Deltaproteobacteria bacterium]|nr:zinc-binding dehydrogenase [Deltaproteobacteria bacterium]
MKSKAMVVVEPGKMEMKEFEVETPLKGQILLKLTTTSVCASDPKILWGHTPYVAFPVIMGHELVGQVAEIDQEASDHYHLKRGDRITVEPMIPCGHCQWCRTEFYYHKCRPMRVYGLTLTADQPPFLFGGYSEFMYLLPGSLVHQVAEGVPDKAASLSSVIGNGVRWVKTLGQMTFGQSLVISGVGSQGLATLIVARECGVGPIAILGLSRDDARFKLAKEFGVDFTINIEKEDPLKVVPEILGGFPDVVVETSGVPSAIQTALNLVKPIGRVVTIGLSGGKETPIQFDLLVAKGVTLLADHAQAGNVKDAMRIINSRKYAIEKINNVTYPLEELPKALEETAHPPDGFIKGAVVFD